MTHSTPKPSKSHSVDSSIFDPRREEICSLLDTYNASERICKVNPSLLLKGGWYAMQKENRVYNVDWMAQSAHSFREIHYGINGPLFISLPKRILVIIGTKILRYKSKSPETKMEKIFESLKSYFVIQSKPLELAKAINKAHLIFTKVSHHFKEKNSLKDAIKLLGGLNIIQTSVSEIEEESYEKLVSTFEDLILAMKPRGLSSHEVIDNIISNKLLNEQTEKTIRVVCFSGGNLDTRRYFFSKVDVSWLRWIWNKGFLDELKKVPVNTTIPYQLPELEYLNRMVESDPQLVTDIILSTPILEETLNPEVVNKFFWIMEALPVEQVKEILPKILSESWIRLMRDFHPSGYSHIKVIESLKQKQDYESLLVLAQVLLTVRQKKDFPESVRLYISEKLFYLSDISESGVFEVILDPQNERKEESLKVFLSILKVIISLGEEQKPEVFGELDPFYLPDIDIFTEELNTLRHSHSREDIQNFIVTCKKLIETTFRLVCNNEIEAKRIYNTYIAPLPDSSTCWRLKLYAITRCPSFFKQEVKDALFRIFEVGERYYEIVRGTEYYWLLLEGFDVLVDPLKREYIEEIINYYGANLSDKRKEESRKQTGLEIITYIKEHLAPEEIVKVESAFGKIPTDKPTPINLIGKGRSGFVLHKSPINPGDFSIPDLINFLKTDASPKVLEEKYQNDDFLNPRDPEGLAEAIKEDFKGRSEQYLEKLNNFFDRDVIDPNYIFAILRQIEDMFRAKKVFTSIELIQIINFFYLIQESGEKKEFEKASEHSYLADWITVHRTMADVLLEVLLAIQDTEVFTNNRARLLLLIKYLLSIKSSPDVEDDKREADQPAHVALNSVRGQAFRAFVQFTYNDGKSLATDVKKVYEHILDTDKSNAIRFTIGQFISSFYFRDIEFIKGVLPKLFPIDNKEAENLFFATWEGYLSSSLYKELFDELQKYYKYAIELNPTTYPNRKYLKGLDETLAAHLALAYAHFDLDSQDPLFIKFWGAQNETRHYEFVSFIGRSCITRGDAGEEWLQENKVSKEKLMKFWDWLLSTNISLEPKTFSGFGFWINPDKEILKEENVIKNLSTSIEKSMGQIDWDYGLMNRLVKFAEVDPQSTFKIIKSFLLLDGELNPHRRVPFYNVDREIKDALKIIYSQEKLKEDVKSLIDTLIEKGSTVFWGLKDILVDQE